MSTPDPAAHDHGEYLLTTVSSKTTLGADMIPIERYRCFIDMIRNQLELEYE